MLIVEPIGGLCNRMRVVDSALSLKQHMDIPLVVIWMLDSSLNCRLDKLFDIQNQLGHVLQLNSKKRLNLLSRKLVKAPFLITERILYDRSKDIQNLQKNLRFDLDPHFDLIDTFTKKLEEKGKYLYICSCYRFHSSENPFTNFTPIKTLQDRIDTYTEKFENVVGVHIRRTDNQHAIANSPLSRFIAYMEDEVSRTSNVKFFLATDSPKVEEILMLGFPGRIITHKKSSLNRDSPAAIQDALIDLYCLSQTRKIIGSYSSTFSETAGLIGRIETLVVKD